MKRFLPLFCLFVLLGLGACSRRVPPAPLTAVETTLAARVDSLGLAEFLALPADAQARRRELARADYRSYDEWHRRLQKDLQARYVEEMGKFELGNIRPGRRTEDRMDKLIPRLHRAANTDPSHVGAAHALGRLLAIVGDAGRARERLLQAWSALPHDPDRKVAEKLRAPILLELAWLHYETGRPDAALDWLARGAGDWTEREAQDAVLIEGLCHAQAGRFGEADRCAGALPPFKFGRAVWNARGEGSLPTGYANRWIVAMAWLHQGDAERAYRALQPINEWRIRLPHAERFWNDVGLICELDGRTDEANSHYAKALYNHWPELVYFPYQGYGSNTLINELPDPRTFYWTSWTEHYLAGSPFSYAARLIDDTYYTDDPVELESLRQRAVEALDVCVRRDIHTDEARALRGWVLYELGETASALVDLEESHAAFRAEGGGDATTSLLLGTLALQAENPAAAVALLQDAVRLDPDYGTAWRTLGVAFASQRRFHEAESAMDRSLEIDPFAASGWHNRGLMSMNLQRWPEAYGDLAVASRLNPGNPETEQMLALARRNWLKEAGEGGAGAADAAADSLAGALRSGTPLVDWPSRPVTLERRAVRIADIDHAACADSLGYVYATAPDDTIRLRLAEESLLAGRPERALELLVPEWRAGLTLTEQHLVLRADRALGLNDRAHELATALLDGEPVCADAPLWSLAAACCLDSGLQTEGLAALDRAIFLDPTNHALKSFRKLVRSNAGP